MHITKTAKDWLAGVRRSLRPSNASRFREQGRAAAAQRNWAEAIVAYQRHLKLRPHDGQTWLRLGNALKDLGKLSEADAAYVRASRASPRSPDVWLNRGHLAKLDGRNEDALRYYKRSFRLSGARTAGREILALSGHSYNPDECHQAEIVGAVDYMIGRTIFGWCVDPDNNGAPAKVELLQSDVKVGEAIANLPRPDVLAAGFGTSSAGFRAKMEDAYKPGERLVVRLSSTRRELANSPYQTQEMDGVGRWLGRGDLLSEVEIRAIRRTNDARFYGTKLSIIMPVYNSNVLWLAQAIESVITQSCSNWELICVDDGSICGETNELLNKYKNEDHRISVISLAENGGISNAVNIGISKSCGNYIAFLDHDDYLEIEAVAKILEASESGADMIYSDELICGEDIDDVVDIMARPAFSYDYYISHPYFVHFVAVRTELAKLVGGYDSSISISMDVDFILRVIERAKLIAHVPVPLYRWRTHSQSAGHSRMADVMNATSSAIQRHHDRVREGAKVTYGKTFNTFRTDYQDDRGSVLVIIPTKNRLDLLRPCVESVLGTTNDEVDIVIIDHESDEVEVADYLADLPDRVQVMPFRGDFNFSKMNNEALSRYGRDYDFVLFLNNDIEAIERGWLEHMRGVCQRKEVGVVGALLLYRDDRVQHGGVVMGVGGPAEHVYKTEPYMVGGGINPGYMSGLVSVRDYMAVTGACMLMKTALFRTLGGFDEELAVGFNDIDLCLRVQQMGYKILFDAHAVLHHYESATRSISRQLLHPEDTIKMEKKWKKLLSEADPYFSPLFGREAPASHSVVGDIDTSAAVRMWARSEYETPLTK